MPHSPHTRLEIDLSALAHNYRYLRSGLAAETRFMGVVKAQAYGSDAVAIAKKLEALGADYLAVAFTAEGSFLRRAGISLPIKVLHPQPSDLEELVESELEPSLYSKKLLLQFRDVVKAGGHKRYPVHLEFNTGLNRLGFREADLDWIPETIAEDDHLSVLSVFSHLAASDDLKQRAFTTGQLTTFQRIASKADSAFPCPPLKHLLNTSGVLHYPEAAWDMVRCGIGLYGYANRPDLDRELRPVARLVTHISQIHDIRAGEYVGYNMGYQASEDRRVATLPLGHADGIGRHYGKGKSSFLVQGKKAPILGNVCMDMIMIDISDIECQEGDEALFFGPELSAEVQARGAGTISYELLTGISPRVRRIILEDS